MAEMYKDTREVAQQTTPFVQEEVRAASKGDKVRTGKVKNSLKSLLALEHALYTC